MITFKNKRDVELFATLNPILILIFADLYNYAKRNYDIELVVTQTITTKEQDELLNRVSNSHRTHRAIDIRTKDIDAFIIQDLIHYINNKPQYEEYRYVSRSGERRLAYYHVGSSEHIHLAIHSRFSY